MSKAKQANKAQAKAIELAWTADAWEDYTYWLNHDVDKAKAIHSLLSECMQTPFTGRGKPEPLRGNLTGLWSRRIDREHRLVYLPEDGMIYVVQCRLHY